MKADAEHQQDHADLGELADRLRIDVDAGRERPRRDPRHQVADERRQAQPGGEETEAEGEHQAGNDRDHEAGVLIHQLFAPANLGKMGRNAAGSKLRPLECTGKLGRAIGLPCCTCGMVNPSKGFSSTGGTSD